MAFESIKAKSTVSNQIKTDNFEFKKADDLRGIEPKVNVYGYIKATFKNGDEGCYLVCSDSTFRKIPSRYIKKFESLSDEDLEVLKSGKPLTVGDKFKAPNGYDTYKIMIGDDEI